MQEAFERYMDHTVDRLTALGIDEMVAMEAVFEAVSQLAEAQTLPPFPEGRVSYQEMGNWLVAAVDLGFADFMVEAVQE